MKYITVIFLFLIFVSCSNPAQKSLTSKTEGPINCTEKLCQGVYVGPEFVNGSDVAHQFSNTMSGVVGDKLKELYDAEKYSKVDFTKIKMSTEGMGSGTVQYKLEIPFVPVQSECEAYTSFDHVGGWNHVPALTSRKKQLKAALLEGDTLNISELKQTKEGLQEYWIQWRNKVKQKDCGLIPINYKFDELHLYLNSNLSDDDFWTKNHEALPNDFLANQEESYYMNLNQPEIEYNGETTTPALYIRTEKSRIVEFTVHLMFNPNYDNINSNIEILDRAKMLDLLKNEEIKEIVKTQNYYKNIDSTYEETITFSTSLGRNYKGITYNIKII